MKRGTTAALALFALVAGCATTPGDAAFEAGRMAFTRGDMQGAYTSFREAAEEGDPRAAKVLGTMLDKGVEVEGGQKIAARPEEAAKWYRKAADAGDAQAANALAEMYTYGRGVPVDYVEAMRLLGPVAGKKEYESIPQPDRNELYLWTHAVKVEIFRQMSKLTHNFAHEVRVNVVFSGQPPHVKLETDDSGRAVEAVRYVAESAVAAAPPTPAAVRRNFKFSEEIAFQ